MCTSRKEDGIGRRCVSHAKEREVTLDKKMRDRVIASTSKEEQAEHKKRLEEAGNMNRKQWYESEYGLSDRDNIRINRLTASHPSVVSARNAYTKASDEARPYQKIIANMSTFDNPSEGDRVNYAMNYNEQYRKNSQRMNELIQKVVDNNKPDEHLKYADEMIKLTNENQKIAQSLPLLGANEMHQVRHSDPRIVAEINAQKKLIEAERKARTHYRQEEVLRHNSSYKNAYKAYVQTPEGQELVKEIAENNVQMATSNEQLKKNYDQVTETQHWAYQGKTSQENVDISIKYAYYQNSVREANDYTSMHRSIIEHTEVGTDVKKPMRLDVGGKKVTVLPSAKYHELLKQHRERDYSSKNKTSFDSAEELYAKEGVTSIVHIRYSETVQDEMEYVGFVKRSIRDEFFQAEKKKVEERYKPKF